MDFPDRVSAEELIVIPGALRARNDRLLPVATEMVVPVIIAATVAVAVIGNPQNAIDGANRATDTGANDTTDGAAHGTSNAVTLIRTFLGATDDALGVAGLRQASQSKKDGRARKEQANG
ncbi:hypothetical protein JJC00_29715 [Bradyrhizobium diazoefficiens]|nr:hypothetical protein JJC00_29715 [Bradyrhizobium diazoefficiens]